jgi:hypothetical protein
VKRLMRPTRTSICIAFQDAGQFYGLRVMIGLSIAILAIVLALIVTGQATPWTVIAYAIFLGGTYLICLVLRLTGWHRIWEPSRREQTSPSGRHLHLSLNFKGLPAMRLATIPHEFTCEVRDPSGARYKTRPGSVGGGGVAVWCSYPDDFDAAPAPVPGIYTVTWKERRPRQVPGGQPPSAGRWRLMDADRFAIRPGRGSGA